MTALAIKHVPLRTVSPTEHHQRLALREWVNCPVCQKAYMGSTVVNGEPEPVRDWGISSFTGKVVYRRLFCDGCNKIFTWYQASDHNGALLQEVPYKGHYGIIPEQSKIDQFLRDHPEAQGVA